MSSSYMKIKDVADLLSIHRNTVKILCERGDIKAIRVGAQTRILPDDLDEYIERQRFGSKTNNETQTL